MKALPSASTMYPAGEVARVGETLDLVGFAATAPSLGWLCQHGAWLTQAAAGEPLPEPSVTRTLALLLLARLC